MDAAAETSADPRTCTCYPGEGPEPCARRFALSMPTAPETLRDALSRYDAAVERLKEIGRAAEALSDENPYLSAVHCALTVQQGTAWTIGIDAPREFLKPLFDAALTNERENVSRMLRKIEAARIAMQQDL